MDPLWPTVLTPLENAGILKASLGANYTYHNNGIGLREAHC